MHRTCGEPDEIKKNTHPKNTTTGLWCDQDVRPHGPDDHVRGLRLLVHVPAQHVPKPFNFTPMAVNPASPGAPRARPSISSGSPHVCPMGRTCGGADGIKKTPVRKRLPLFFLRMNMITALFSPHAAYRPPLPHHPRTGPEPCVRPPSRSPPPQWGSLFDFGHSPARTPHVRRMGRSCGACLPNTPRKIRVYACRWLISPAVRQNFHPK